MNKALNFKKIETKILNQREIYFSGFGDSWDVQIYFNGEDGHYYLKGPFGRWDGICYNDLGGLRSAHHRL